jgi:hypothetical protein
MRVKFCVSGLAAWGLVATLLAINDAAAKPLVVSWGGAGSFKSKPAPSPKAPPHRASYMRPWFRGIYAGYAPWYFNGAYLPSIEETLLPERLDPYLPPPRGLDCQRSVETVTVPTESGGERTINVTRC